MRYEGNVWMKKIGPLTSDLVIACKIFEYHKQGVERVEFSQLTDSLSDILSKATVLNGLDTLSDWGIVNTEFGETRAGRAGRLFSISGEAEVLIRETYDKFWDKVLNR